MPLPVKTLAIVEQWDCSGCARCCRGSVVPLDDDDLQRLRDRHWEQHPDFRDVQVVQRQGWLSGAYRLAQRHDGTCVFLSEDGRCRIHQEYGFDSKPLVCRMYPLQLVPVDKAAFLTLRRSCPTAAADCGRDISEYRAADVNTLVKASPGLTRTVRPPAIWRGAHRSWGETLSVANAFERLLTDERYPLIRRLVHGLRFCDVLVQCRLKRVDAQQLSELADILADNAPQESGDWFRDRKRPGASAGVLFRQTVANYLQLHPRYTTTDSSWRARLRLSAAALAFARGQGQVPSLSVGFPEISFEGIEDATLGHMDEAIQQPLTRYYQTTAMSKQYAVVSRPGWSLVEKYRALALTYPVALWMLRYFCGDAGPTARDAIDIITAIDRGQGFGPLCGRHHRRRLSNLCQLGELERLSVWYAR